MKVREEDQLPNKQALKHKWNRILIMKSIKLGENIKDNWEAQMLEILMVINAFKANELNVEEV